MALDPDMITKSQKICNKLHSYGIEIRKLNFDSYQDVGEMSKKDFLKRSKEAKAWETNDRLRHLISKIKSGSLV